MSSANTAPSPGDLFSLDGKVAVITGGASGIGAATCRRFTAAGARCVIADIVDVAEGTEAAADLGGQYRQTDVSDTGQVDELVAAVVAQHGQLDIMVNNAGVLGPDGGLLAAEPDEARRMLDINLMGVAHGIRAAATRMAPGGAIVNTASMAGVVGFPGLGWYGAAKWGVVGLTKHAAVELGPKGIRVNCVCPTGVLTDGFVPDDALDHWAVRSQSLANQHVRRLASAEEVAAAIHFLASGDAAMVNGHALHVDGGMSAGLSTQLIEAAVDTEIVDENGLL